MRITFNQVVLLAVLVAINILMYFNARPNMLPFNAIVFTVIVTSIIVRLKAYNGARNSLNR